MLFRSRWHMTKSERQHYDKVARLGCALCRHLGLPYDGGVEIHHIRRFGGKRANAPVSDSVLNTTEEIQVFMVLEQKGLKNIIKLDKKIC